MKLNKLVLFIILTVSISMVACNTEESNTGNGLDSGSAEILANSIINLPRSLSARQTSQTTKGDRSSEDLCECDNNDSMINIYQGIKCYVGVAEGIKQVLKN